MNQSIYFLLFGIFICVFSSAVGIQPRDLVDEAKAQIAELRALVQVNIDIGLDAITNVAHDLYIYRTQSVSAVRTSFIHECENFIAQLDTLNNLGESAGIDVTSCTTPYVRPINTLRMELEPLIFECQRWATDELETIEKDAKYFVDIIMTEVEVFEFQLNVCKGELLCIEPILTKIEAAMIELSQKIEVETNKSKDLGENLKLLIDQCSAKEFTEMMAKGTALVAEAEDCVQKMLA